MNIFHLVRLKFWVLWPVYGFTKAYALVSSVWSKWMTDRFSGFTHHVLLCVLSTIKPALVHIIFCKLKNLTKIIILKWKGKTRLVNVLLVDAKVGQVGLLCRNINHFQYDCLHLLSARAERAIPNTFQRILLLIKAEHYSWSFKWWLDLYRACQIKIAYFKILIKKKPLKKKGQKI